MDVWISSGYFCFFRHSCESRKPSLHDEMSARRCGTISPSMHEHVPSSLIEKLSLEEEKDLRLRLFQELKSIIKKYAPYYVSDKDDEKEPTPQQFFAWIEMLAEGGTIPLDEHFNEQVLAHDVRRFEKIYQELANIALKKPLSQEIIKAYAEPAEFYQLRAKERERLFAFFGKETYVPPLPEGITPELMHYWDTLSFKLEFWPRKDMTRRKAKMGLYPGWVHPPEAGPKQGLKFCIFEDAEELQKLSKNQKNPHLKNVKPTELLGQWMLRDTRKTPEWRRDGNHAYENDGAIEGILQDLAYQWNTRRLIPGGKRTNIEPALFEEQAFWDAFRSLFRLDTIPGAVVRLPRIIEANVMNQERGKNSIEEWREEMWSINHRDERLCGDGLGTAVTRGMGYPSASVGFRPLVLFPRMGK